jgi:hypothetical protein
MKSQYSRSDKILHEILAELHTIISELSGDFEYSRQLERFEAEVTQILAAGPRSRSLDSRIQLGYCIQNMEEIREKHKRRRRIIKDES